MHCTSSVHCCLKSSGHLNWFPNKFPDLEISSKRKKIRYLEEYFVIRVRDAYAPNIVLYFEALENSNFETIFATNSSLQVMTCINRKSC